MIIFLIKSTLCMGALLMLYYILFEKEKMHRFNRFYLISALIFSLAVPFITVITYTENIPTSNISPAITTTSTIPHVVSEQPLELINIGWAVYAIITSILMIRFIKNIMYFLKKASASPRIKMRNATLVLLDEKVLPHSFLNYIFVNRVEHEACQIEDELYAHEYIHIRQKHTLDVLFIEVLITLLWFNPLLYFYKKAIQLNHEFLADEEVIRSMTSASCYQKLLLSKTSSGMFFDLASNLKFSLTKKRFIMMTKTTSALKASLLKATILPAIAIITLLLCTETVAQENPAIKLQNINRIRVDTVTKSELDSLQQVDPVKYEGEKADILKTTVTHNENGNEKDTVYYDRRTKHLEEFSEPTNSSLSRIEADKMKSIEMLALTQFEKNTLNQLDPTKYNDSTFQDYMAVKVTFVNAQGHPEAHTTYEKKPKF